MSELDPVRTLQNTVRQAGQRLRRGGVITAASDERQHLEGEDYDRFFNYGREQVENLARTLREHFGFDIDGRTAIDYGCGVGRVVIPLAPRMEKVYGVDIEPALLVAAERYAAGEGVTNAEWMLVDRLPELMGRYDVVFSHWVFQHIPTREGERIFGELVRGLRPGGAGALHVTLRPRLHPSDLRNGLDFWYQLINSYSLGRLGRLLADEGITEWHLRWLGATARYPSATIFFRKGE